MSRRRAHSALLVFVACVALAHVTAGELRIFWRSIVLSWDRPATQGLDELSVQATLDADPQGEVQRAALPVDGNPRRHVADATPSSRSSINGSTPSRSPPSA
jgi:hypothetical protein